jgi:hypothetical protein
MWSKVILAVLTLFSVSVTGTNQLYANVVPNPPFDEKLLHSEVVIIGKIISIEHATVGVVDIEYAVVSITYQLKGRHIRRIKLITKFKGNDGYYHSSFAWYGKYLLDD